MSLLVALASVVLAALLAVAAQAGIAVLAATVAFIALGVALGWAVLLDLPHPRGTLLVVVAAGWAATGAALLTDDRAQPLGIFAVLLAGSVLLAFLHELVRRDGRHALVESVTGTVSGQVVVVLGAGWVFLPTSRLGVGGVVVAAAATAVTSLVLAAPLPPSVLPWVALGAGGVASAVAAVVLASPYLLGCIVLGVCVAAAVAGLSILLRTLPAAQGPVGLVAAASAPVCAVGTVAFAVARLAAG